MIGWMMCLLIVTSHWLFSPGKYYNVVPSLPRTQDLTGIPALQGVYPGSVSTNIILYYIKVNTHELSRTTIFHSA